MNLRTKLCATGATLATTAALGLVPAAAASAAPSAAPTAAPAAATPRATAAPIPLTFPTALGTFNGVFTPSGFTNQNGALALTGVVTGTVTSATGAVTQVPAQTITTTVIGAATTGSCQILDLVLGPLDLNVLGLNVHLDRVHLNITAQRGPGNLLGNLLCAVAGLLDGNGVNGLAALLNRLLGL